MQESIYVNTIKHWRDFGQVELCHSRCAIELEMTRGLLVKIATGRGYLKILQRILERLLTVAKLLQSTKDVKNQKTCSLFNACTITADKSYLQPLTQANYFITCLSSEVVLGNCMLLFCLFFLCTRWVHIIQAISDTENAAFQRFIFDNHIVDVLGII